MSTPALEVSPLEHHAPYGFQCSSDEQNTFLIDDAIRDQREDISRTFLAYRNTILVGYFTITMDAIPLMTSEKPRSDIKYLCLPAVKLAQLAVQEHLEGQGLGKQLVAASMSRALELRDRIGCRYLTVDARTPRLVEWYKEQGFKINRLNAQATRKRAEKKGIAVDELPTSMRFDLHHLLQDLADHYPNDFSQPS